MNVNKLSLRHCKIKILKFTFIDLFGILYTTSGTSKEHQEIVTGSYLKDTWHFKWCSKDVQEEVVNGSYFKILGISRDGYWKLLQLQGHLEL